MKKLLIVLFVVLGLSGLSTQASQTLHQYFATNSVFTSLKDTDYVVVATNKIGGGVYVGKAALTTVNRPNSVAVNLNQKNESLNQFTPLFIGWDSSEQPIDAYSPNNKLSNLYINIAQGANNYTDLYNDGSGRVYTNKTTGWGLVANSSGEWSAYQNNVLKYYTVGYSSYAFPPVSTYWVDVSNPSVPANFVCNFYIKFVDGYMTFRTEGTWKNITGSYVGPTGDIHRRFKPTPLVSYSPDFRVGIPARTLWKLSDIPTTYSKFTCRLVDGNGGGFSRLLWVIEKPVILY